MTDYDAVARGYLRNARNAEKLRMSALRQLEKTKSPAARQMLAQMIGGKIAMMAADRQSGMGETTDKIAELLKPWHDENDRKQIVNDALGVIGSAITVT